MEENLARLSQRDVELLAADPNPANRQDAMLRVAEIYSFEPLTPSERQIALAIVQTVLMMFEWLTLWPTIGPLPVSSHLRDMAHVS